MKGMTDEVELKAYLESHPGALALYNIIHRDASNASNTALFEPSLAEFPPPASRPPPSRSRSRTPPPPQRPTRPPLASSQGAPSPWPPHPKQASAPRSKWMASEDFKSLFAMSQRGVDVRGGPLADITNAQTRSSYARSRSKSPTKSTKVHSSAPKSSDSQQVEKRQVVRAKTNERNDESVNVNVNVNVQTNNQVSSSSCSVKLDNVKDPIIIFKAMINLVTGLDIKERPSGIKRWKYSIVSNKLVDWLVNSGISSSREDGVRIANDLCRLGFIAHPITKAKEFKDERDIFVLTLKGKMLYSEQTLQYFKNAFDPKTGIGISDRVIHSILFSDCFTGSHLVDWFLKEKIISNRIQGLKIGKAFLETDLIEHIDQDQHFSDSLSVYQMTKRGKSKIATFSLRTEKSNQRVRLKRRTASITLVPDTIDSNPQLLLKEHLQDKLGLKYFSLYLAKSHHFKDMDFLGFIEQIRKIENETDKTNHQFIARNIYQTYLRDSSENYVKLPEDIVSKIDEAFLESTIPPDVFNGSQSFILKELSNHWNQYLNSSHYSEYGQEKKKIQSKPENEKAKDPSLFRLDHLLEIIHFYHSVSHFKLNFANWKKEEVEIEAQSIISQYFEEEKAIIPLDSKTHLLLSEILKMKNSIQVDSFDKLMNQVIEKSQVPFQKEILPNFPSVILRRFNKRGGIRIAIPDSLDKILYIAEQKLKIKPVLIREDGTEAEVTHISLISPNSVLFVTTEQEELQYFM